MKIERQTEKETERERMIKRGRENDKERKRMMNRQPHSREMIYLVGIICKSPYSKRILLDFDKFSSASRMHVTNCACTDP